MPIYEYRCTGCGKEFEKFQRITDRPLTRCKFCKGKVTRLISNSAFILKGSGWYATDYPRGDGKAADHKDKRKETETEGPFDKEKAKKAMKSVDDP